jgi:TctA family transporter
MGASLRYAYILPMVAAFLQILGSVYLLAHTILRSRSKALLTYLFFFLNGGLGFFYFINWSQDGGYTLKDIFTGFYTTPTNLVDHNIRWVNVIADMFLQEMDKTMDLFP